MCTTFYKELDHLPFKNQAVDESTIQPHCLHQTKDTIKRPFYLAMVYWFSSIFVIAICYCFLSFMLGLLTLSLGQFVFWIIAVLFCYLAVGVIRESFGLDGPARIG